MGFCLLIYYQASHEKIQAPGNTNRNITEYESVQSNTTDSALGYEMAVAKFDYNAQRVTKYLIWSLKLTYSNG